MAEKTVFAQLVQLISRHEFNQCVERHWGHHGVRHFSCWDQYLAMAFAQLTGRDGLRDIEACLQSQRDKLYRIGFRGRVSRSTLADANAKRSFLIYQDFGLHLIARAHRLHQDEPFALDLKQAVLALDSTTIDRASSACTYRSSRGPTSARPRRRSRRIRCWTCAVPFPVSWR